MPELDDAPAEDDGERAQGLRAADEAYAPSFDEFITLSLSSKGNRCKGQKPWHESNWIWAQSLSA
jgi:hypothetical protein